MTRPSPCLSGDHCHFADLLLALPVGRSPTVLQTVAAFQSSDNLACVLSTVLARSVCRSSRCSLSSATKPRSGSTNYSVVSRSHPPGPACCQCGPDIIDLFTSFVDFSAAVLCGADFPLSSAQNRNNPVDAMRSPRLFAVAMYSSITASGIAAKRRQRAD